MKKYNITKWAALLLTFSGMAAWPLNLSAANLTVNTGTVVDGAAYDNGSAGTAYPLRVNATGNFSGTNITVTSNAANRPGVYVITGTATIHTGTITTSGNTASAVQVLTAGRFEGSDLTIISTANNAHGVLAQTESEVSLSNVSISATGINAFGLRSTGTSRLTAVSGSAHTYGSGGRGVDVGSSSTVSLSNFAIVTEGDAGVGLYLNQADGSAAANAAFLDRVQITTGGASADSYGIRISSNSLLELRNSTVTSTGDLTAAIFFSPETLTSGTALIEHSVIIAERGYGMVFGNDTDRAKRWAAVPDFDNIQMTCDVTVISSTISTLSKDEHDAIHVNNFLSGTLTGGDGTVLTGSYHVVAANIHANDTVIDGNVGVLTSATANLDLQNGSQLNGDIYTNGSAALTVTLNDSVMTGVSSVSDSGIINLSLNNHANWNLTGKSKLTTLHGANGGSITIANVQGDDLTVSGGITGQTALHLTLSDSVKSQTEIRVVVDETNAMSNSAFTLGSEVSNGMYDYVLENNADGAWLVYTAPVDPPVDPPVNPPVNPPTPPVISSEGDTVINTAAAVAGFWFTQLDNLHKRMGELRYNHSSSTTTLTGKDNKSVTLSGEQLLENIWVRAYGQQINANTGISGVKGFSETQYGVDLGTDHRWTLDADNQLYTGVFAGYGGADRQFHSNYSGNTDSGYGGLYATWLNHSGWYADVVAKGQYFRNDFTGADQADYDSVGVGFSVELGRQFEFKDGWFAEPSVQFSYLHLMNDNYTTRDGMHVDLTDADVLHIYGGARFGRNIKLTHSGMLQPYIKAGGLGQISSGNKVTVSGDHWRPNLDGARAVIGAGLVWQLDANNQLHLDYEASFGEKYDKPWGVNLGYRYQF